MSLQVLLLHNGSDVCDDKFDRQEDNGLLNPGYWQICCCLFCFLDDRVSLFRIL